MDAAQMNPQASALEQAVAVAVPLLREHCRDTWVVIGSAAAALAGANVDVADLDVLTTVDDAERLIMLLHERLDTSYAPAGADRFRSRFARFRFPGMPMEVMGGLELYVSQGWQPVRVNEIAQLSCAGLQVPTPSIAEQIRILESFDRPKDLQRAAVLRTMDSGRAMPGVRSR
jgi:hypothetical protein